MRALLILALVVLTAVPPAQAQTVRVVAITDFENISLDSGWIPPAHLSEVLRQLLQQQAGGQWRVISGDSVRAAMRARGFTELDLIYPSRAAAVAEAVGAEWVVTGRWTQLRFIGRSTPEDPSSPSIRQGDAFAIADVEVRVFEVSSRRRLLEERFSGRSVGGDHFSLLFAATEALRGAATRIARLQ
jgi:hypothetical protein